MLNLAVLGAGGRMGREVVRAVVAADDCRLAGAMVRPGSADVGRDAGEAAGTRHAGVLLCDSPAAALAGAGVAIDFTLAAATVANLAACRAAGCALVVGVTGHDPQLSDDIGRAAQDIPILRAANLSRGAAVLRRLAALAAEALPVSYDVAILDSHHRLKRDAPSGTALALGEIIAASRRDSRAARDRANRSESKPEDAIRFASVRAGDIVGEHTVLFAGGGERIELTHRVQHRASFAEGALVAARWLAAQPPGLYGMDDVV